MAGPASTISNFTDAYKDYFACPISQEMMTQPVVNENCGHTFEEGQIEGWKQKKISQGQVPGCPLCQKVLGNFIPNLLLKQAIEVLNDPSYTLVKRLEDLSDEDIQAVSTAFEAIVALRNKDGVNNIPVKLDPAQNFIKSVENCAKDYCC